MSPRWGPAGVPPYQRGCATVKRRCRRMLWFTRSFLKSTGELRGDAAGEAPGEAPGERCAEGSMARSGAPRPGGEAALPAGAEQEACGRSSPGPGGLGKLSIPLPPAPGKLNNCLAPAAGTWSGSPPAAPARCAARWPCATSHPAVPEVAAAPQGEGVLCPETRQNAALSPE